MRVQLANHWNAAPPRLRFHFTRRLVMPSLREHPVFVERSDNRKYVCSRRLGYAKYRKIPLISPGPIQLRKGFWVGLQAGERISGEA